MTQYSFVSSHYYETYKPQKYNCDKKLLWGYLFDFTSQIVVDIGWNLFDKKYIV